MKLETLTIKEFTNWAIKSDEITFHQTKEWADLKKKNGWKAYYVGLKDKKEIKAASLILAKEIPVIKKKMFYAPRGFLIDYHDLELLTIFTKEIKKWAKEENSEVYEMKLLSQFRCNGSNGYLAWIDDVLQIRETANFNLEGLDYDIRILDDPQEVLDLVVEKNKVNNKSRLLAGYCWKWPKLTRSDTNFHDIKIGDFEISWNLQNGKEYALDENSVHEAGCIHTTQGLEFDYVGVIIGDDMRYENGKIITDYTKRASTDQSIKGLKKLYKENKEEALKRADEIIKNTYRTLMTRGMKGCYVYCTDKNLRDYMKSRIGK